LVYSQLVYWDSCTHTHTHHTRFVYSLYTVHTYQFCTPLGLLVTTPRFVTVVTHTTLGSHTRFPLHTVHPGLPHTLRTFGLVYRVCVSRTHRTLRSPVHYGFSGLGSITHVYSWIGPHGWIGYVGYLPSWFTHTFYYTQFSCCCRRT